MKNSDNTLLFGEISLEEFKKSVIEKSKTIGKQIFYFNSIDSTNTFALILAEKGYTEGTVVIANKQLSGRGRFDRKWLSPADKNIYMSIILKPEVLTRHIPLLTFMSAISCASAIIKTTPINVSLKWPNDLVVNGKKLGGILIETRSEKNKINYATVGIGINVNFSIDEMPEDIKDTATSIKEETGIDYPRTQIVAEVLKDLDRWYHIFLNKGYDDIKREWLRLSSTIGKFIRVKSGNNIYEGYAAGIDDDGMLLLDDGKSLEKINSGDVTVIK